MGHIVTTRMIAIGEALELALNDTHFSWFTAKAFMHIADNDPDFVTVTDIVRATGAAEMSVRHALVRLADGVTLHGKPHIPGAELITSHRGIARSNQNCYVLTPKGQALMDEVQRIMAGR